MLVLSRKTDESIQIGSDIEIKVLDIRGNRVRLGISAPSDVAIHRSEVTLRLAEEVPSRVASDSEPLDTAAVASLLRIAR